MKKLNKFAVILGIMSLGYNAQAQAPAGGTNLVQPTGLNGGPAAPKATGRISGTVVDAKNQLPVQYATIGLLDANTGKAVDGTMTDEKGKFLLNKVAYGSYKLEISFIGYEARTVSDLSVSASKDVINLGNLALNVNATALKEVTVEGQRAMFEERVDRTVYNAENDATNRGGDAADVLRKVPMLSVDLEGNVSLRGSQNIRVLINNRPSTITAGSVADALKQIPADMIKSVEVITSPSAKYDAEGSSGIINIITKKNTLQGATLNIDAGAGLRGSNLGLNGSYRKGKMGFSLGGFGRAGYNVKGRFENEQTTKENGVAQQTTLQSADTRNNMMFGRYSLGWDWDINEKNYINASVQYGLRNWNAEQDNLTALRYQDGNVTESSFRDVETFNNGGNVDVNLNYTHLFAKPQQEFSILTQFSRDNQTSNFINNVLTGSEGTIESRLKNLNESFNQEATVQLDYQNPIQKNQMLELGGKRIMRQVISDYQYFSADGANGAYVPLQNTNLSNIFNYNQDITAGYLSYTYSTPSLYTIKAGARYEYTTINADFEESDEKVTIPSYGSLVPSVNLSKRLANGNTLKLAYNRRIQRPSLRFLNPNIQAANPLNITEGNPNLDPEFSNNFEIGYNTFIKQTSLNFSAFARNTNNSIQSVRDIIGDTIRTTFLNIGKEDAYGFNLFGNVNLSNKLTLNGGTDIYYAVLDNNVPNSDYNASNQGWVFNVRGMGSYKLGNGWGLQGFGFYRAGQVQLQGYESGFGIYSLNVRKEFNEGRGSIGFGAENFLTNTMNRRTVLNSPILDQTSNNVMFNRNVKVNFSYRIGKISADGQARRRRKSVTNDDLKGGGGDQTDSSVPLSVGPTGGGAAAGGQGATAPGQAGGQGTRAGVAPGQQGQRPGQAPSQAPVAAPAQDQSLGQSPDSSLVANPNGRWVGTMGGGFEITLNLQAEGNSLTGTVLTQMGESPISDGKINGNEFSFTVSLGDNTIPYKGRIDGDTLSLIVNFQGQDVEGTLTRAQ